MLAESENKRAALTLGFAVYGRASCQHGRSRVFVLDEYEQLLGHQEAAIDFGDHLFDGLSADLKLARVALCNKPEVKPGFGADDLLEEFSG